MTEAAPGTPEPGAGRLVNPVFDLLDYPIVQGRAEEVFLSSPLPEIPPPPAGISAAAAEKWRAAKTAEARRDADLSYETALDRVAKCAGVFAALGLQRNVLFRDAELAADDTAWCLAVLAAVRIGMSVSLDGRLPGSGGPTAGPAASGAGEGDGAELVRLIAHAGSPETERAVSISVRNIRSYFERRGLQIGETSFDLDAAMRDSHVEPAAAQQIPAGNPLLYVNGRWVPAAEAAETLRENLPIA